MPKISELTTTSDLSGDELVPIVKAGTTKRTTIGDINGVLGDDLAASGGSALVGFIQAGTGAAPRTMQDKAREILSVKDFGAVGDGVTDDTAAIQAAIDSLVAGECLVFPAATAYRITSGLDFTGKARCKFDFNDQYINATGFAAPGTALYFTGIEQSTVRGIFLVGNANVTIGVHFDAGVGQRTISAKIDRVYVNGCGIGVQFGPDSDSTAIQFSDCDVHQITASECDTGILLSGANTLAMTYGTLTAYLNDTYGVHFRAGNGIVNYLDVASNAVDVFFGYPDGTNHEALQRWDITGGYSEEGRVGEVFISSAACTDTNPFLGQIVLRGFRCTPFASTTVQDFIRWRLNGDLIFKNCTFTIETNFPRALLEANATYRAPSVKFEDCVIDGSDSGAPQVIGLVKTSSARDSFSINSQVNKGISMWNNAGAANEGTIKRGIYTDKLEGFARTLLSLPSLVSAWPLLDLFSTSQQAKNLILGGPVLAASAMLETRDFWMDDGLVGILKNTTTTKSVTTSDALFSPSAGMTFGAILRTLVINQDNTDETNVGGTTGMRLGLGDFAGGFAVCRVGGVEAQAAVVNGLDPHLVIGRYVSATSVKVDAINLRTGEKVSATNVAAIPGFGALTWVNGLTITNVGTVKGMPFFFSRELSDAEVSQLQQAATALTDSWRLA
jgi:hypothetical protein